MLVPVSEKLEPHLIYTCILGSLKNCHPLYTNVANLSSVSLFENRGGIYYKSRFM